MYFWRIEALKRDLVARALTDREVLPYLLVFVGITGLIPVFPPQSMNAWDCAAAVWTFLLTIAGTLYLYWCNGGSAGVHFDGLLRCFSWWTRRTRAPARPSPCSS